MVIVGNVMKESTLNSFKNQPFEPPDWTPWIEPLGSNHAERTTWIEPLGSNHLIYGSASIKVNCDKLPEEIEEKNKSYFLTYTILHAVVKLILPLCLTFGICVCILFTYWSLRNLFMKVRSLILILVSSLFKDHPTKVKTNCTSGYSCNLSGTGNDYSTYIL